MNIDPSPHLKELHYTEILQLLSTACDWLTIRHGRATKYARLIKEFLGEDKRTREHILAYNESCEIIEFYEMWKVKVGNFPGIEHQIKSALNKGPILREDERAESSTNRPRNDAFVYLLAGKLMRAGIEVTAVDGTAVKGIGCHKDADITLDWNASIIDIECKRPQTEGALEGRVKKACDQLLNPSQSSPMGIIAIDCSAFIRPLGTLLEEDSAERAEVLLSRLLQEKISQKV